LATLLAFNFLSIGACVVAMGVYHPLEDLQEWDLVHNLSTYLVIGMFGVFLILYIVVAVLVTRSLKKFYPKFYLRERTRILSATLSMIFSIVARIVFNFVQDLKSVDEALSISELNNTWLYPLFNFSFDITTSIWPIASAIYSLMYMITHQKNIIEIQHIDKGECPNSGEGVFDPI
jgi:hypothetical protein